MITKQNKTTSQQDRDKRELPQLGKKSTKTKQNKKTTNQKHFNEADENRQKCSKPYRKTADKIRA